MKLILSLLALFLLCSCSSGKPQFVPPPPPEEPEPVIEQSQSQPVDEVVEEAPAPPAEENTFLSILMQEGAPTENVIPRSKEQVAVYHQGETVRFYYFKRNKLVAQRDYPARNVELMKAAGNYPDSILQDMGIK